MRYMFILGLMVLSAVCWVVIGASFAEWSEETVARQDHSSGRAFLLFPLATCRGRAPWFCPSPNASDGHQLLYRFSMMYLWPVKIGWNAATVPLLSPWWLLRR
ncbi:MAG: hypothetical protein PHT12_06055 [Patescibacteria group bacterium]|nr:hypothetical protein [Patescibacteria group bacterium]